MNGGWGHLAVVMDYIMCNHAHYPLSVVVTLYSDHPRQHCTSALSSSLWTSPFLMLKSGSTKKGAASTQNIFNKPWVPDCGQRTARADCKSDLHDFVSGEASTPSRS